MLCWLCLTLFEKLDAKGIPREHGSLGLAKALGHQLSDATMMTSLGSGTL
jgi:hypothetical protein